MSDAQKPEVSDEQAQEALSVLLKGEQSEPGDGVVTARIPETEDTPREETPAETEPEAAAVEESEPVEETVDDIETLKASLKERDERISEMTQQSESIRERAAQSLQWAKDLALKKSTETDKLKRYLQDLAGKEEIDRSEIQRVLGGDIQPQQGFQQPQQPQYQPQPQQVDEFSAIDEQMFLLDNPLTEEQYQKFYQFIKTENVPGAYVPGNTYATLSRFKHAYDQKLAAESGKKAKVAKSVQRVQKQAQRAAGSISGRASPSAPPEAPKGFHDMSIKEIEDTPELLSSLFRRSIED